MRSNSTWNDDHIVLDYVFVDNTKLTFVHVPQDVELGHRVFEATKSIADSPFGDEEGYIHAIDPLNGKTIGRKKISKHSIINLVSRSDKFYVVDENLQLFSLSI